jgi:alpha-ketoglutarate-dependent taurine dioxygenase
MELPSARLPKIIILHQVRHADMPVLIESRSWSNTPMILAEREGEELLSIDQDLVKAQLRSKGALLFRSFAIGVERFQALVCSYSSNRITYPGGDRLPVSLDRRIQTVAGSAEPIRLHSELSHTPFRPDLCWFYCVTAPATGSETILCDGLQLASALPLSVKNLLEQSRLRYRRTMSIAYLEQLLGIKGTEELREFLATRGYGTFYEILGNEVRQDFIAPALHQGRFLQEPIFANNILHNARPGRPLRYPTFGDGNTIPESVIAAIGSAAAELTFALRWCDGDLLVFDNTRFLHGRNPIVDPRRTIWTQFSDADF